MIDVFSQGYEAALLFCAGIATGLLYSLTTALGRYRPAPFRHALDGVFVLLSGGLLLIGALLASNGRMRAYYLAADALGAWLTAWAFRPLALRLGRRRRVDRNSRETGETEPKGF